MMNGQVAHEDEDPEIAALEAEVAALAACSFRLSPRAQRLADLAQQKREHLTRLNNEGQAALAAQARAIEAACQAKLGPAVTLSTCLDWRVCKATAALDAVSSGDVESIIASGRGVIVVRGARGKAATACVAALGQAGAKGRSGLFVNEQAAVQEVLRNACVHPDLPTLNEWFGDDRLVGLLASAAREAADLAGTWAETTAGK